MNEGKEYCKILINLEESDSKKNIYINEKLINLLLCFLICSNSQR